MAPNHYALDPQLIQQRQSVGHSVLDAVAGLGRARQSMPTCVRHQDAILGAQRIGNAPPASAAVGKPVQQHDGWLAASLPVVYVDAIHVDGLLVPGAHRSVFLAIAASAAAQY